MRWVLVLLAAILACAPGLALAQGGRTVALSRMGASLEDGATIGEIQIGRNCTAERKLHWTGGSDRLDASRFADAFREAMLDSGVKVAGGDDGASHDLFTRPAGHGDLQVGALVTSLHVTTCTNPYDRDGNTDGRASLQIEWQIYSVEEGKVVARITTNGSAGSTRPGSEVIDRVLAGAFRRAAEDLAGDPQFLRLVRVAAPPAGPAAPLTGLVVALAAPHPTAIAQAAGAVVSVVVPDGHGSGVLVSADGYILTNRHVAGDAGKVRVVWADGSESVGQVLRADRQRDVALVKVDVPKAAPLAIRHTPAQSGETVFAIGTPLDKALAGTLTRGVVSALRKRDGQSFIQSDVSVTHGNSGGPLLDEHGEILGLTVSGISADDGGSMGLNFFIPIDDALRALAIQPPVAEAPAPTPAPLHRTATPPKARSTPRS